METTTQVLICSICGDEIDDPLGIGHNPAPVKNEDDDRCCRHSTALWSSQTL
jgi:hypothetical protein